MQKTDVGKVKESVRQNCRLSPQKQPPPPQMLGENLQQLFGNRVVGRLAVQRKMTLNAVGDKYEQEADAVARQVVRRLNASQPTQRQATEEKEPVAAQRQISVMRQDTASKEKETSSTATRARRQVRKNLTYPKQIRYYRNEIGKLRKKIPQLSKLEQRKILSKIFQYEKKLKELLKQDIVKLSEQIQSMAQFDGFSNKQSDDFYQQLEQRLANEKALLEKLERVFDSSVAASFALKYKTEIRPFANGFGCMTAVYKGLEILHSPQEALDLRKKVYKESQEVLKRTKRDTRNMMRIMETLKSTGKAGEKVTLKYIRSQKAWIPSPQNTILRMSDPQFPGWYFYGLSLHHTYHSVILAVDTTEGRPKIFWMDQHSKGFTNDVTNTLKEKMERYTPRYGFKSSYVWPILPTESTVIEIP